MFNEIRSGDLIAVSGRGLVSCGIQLGSLSLPNIGPLGRWGWAGASHVGIAQWAYTQSGPGDLLVFESTSFNRPPCVLTHRENPKGVQAHYLSDIIDGGGDVWHYPLRSPLYLDEEDRLLEFLVGCLGRGYDFVGAGKSGGGLAMRAIQRLKGSEDLSGLFCSELVIRAWIQLRLMQHKNAGAWSPVRTVRYALRRGICDPGRLLS